MRGKRFTLEEGHDLKGKLLGDADPPTVKNPRVRVHRKMQGKGESELDVLVHEALHLAFWDVDEEVINRVGLDMARMLWKLGYRRFE